MLMTVRNWTEAPRYSATYAASETAILQVGSVVKIVDDGTGNRRMELFSVSGDSAFLKPSRFGLAYKVSTDPYQATRTTAPDFTGIRLVQIYPGDSALVVYGESIVDLDPSILDATLDPSRSGVLPAVGDVIGVNPVNGLLCKNNLTGAIISPVAFVTYLVQNGQISILVRNTPA